MQQGITVKTANSRKIKKLIDEFLEGTPYNNIISAAHFRTVYTNLMDEQKEWLKKICGPRFDILSYQGMFLSIGIAYYDPIIDSINNTKKGQIDFDEWNKYSIEYEKINGILDDICVLVARRLRGIPIPATLYDMADKVDHVHDYFGMTISHRMIAELAGLGWRGKNGLTINEQYSCAIRFTSVITEEPFNVGSRIESKCDDCTACEDACTFIKHRDILPDYRENCRRYINYLVSQGLYDEVCGKCILACYRSSKFANQFRLSTESE